MIPQAQTRVADGPIRACRASRTTATRVRRLALCAVITIAAPKAWADGEFFQVDVSPSTTGVVFTIGRDAFSFGANYVRYDGGAEAILSALYALPLPATAPTVRLGPSLGYIDTDTGPADTEAGVKLVVEKWMPTEFGSLFLLAEGNTIENSVFALAQFGFSRPDLYLEMSVGQSDTYSETTIAVSKPVGQGPLALRAGYRFDAGEIFLGFSINTF